MPSLFSSLYTIFAGVARRDHLTPSASTASLGIRSLPLRSYFASARNTSALTARRTAGEIAASARRRDGPCFIESQNSSRLLKTRSEEHTSELQSRLHLVCRLLLEKKKKS